MRVLLISYVMCSSDCFCMKEGASSLTPALVSFRLLMAQRKKKEDEKKHHGAVGSFVNRTQLLLLCEKSGAILLVLVGLTTGRLAGSQTKYW